MTKEEMNELTETAISAQNALATDETFINSIFDDIITALQISAGKGRYSYDVGDLIINRLNEINVTNNTTRDEVYALLLTKFSELNYVVDSSLPHVFDINWT